MTMIADCIWYRCTKCKSGSFSKPGEALADTGVCRPCRMGWRHLNKKKNGKKRSVPSPKDVSSPDEASNPYGVRPGQVWVSLDPRDNGREIEVLEVNGEKATVLSNGARKRQIKLTSFTKVKGRGYARKG